jgi:hypothetical protein
MRETRPDGGCVGDGKTSFYIRFATLTMEKGRSTIRFIVGYIAPNPHDRKDRNRENAATTESLAWISLSQEATVAQEQEPQAAKGQEVLKTEVFIETYQIIAEWIRFADAKAAVTLTVNGVLLGVLIPTLKTYLGDRDTVHPASWWNYLVVVLFIGWLLLLVVSAINSFLCILPIRGPQRLLTLDKATHFHPAAVSKSYTLDEHQRFIIDCERIGMDGLKREVIAAILIDSHLSSSKYRNVSRSIWCLAGSVAFGFLYLLAIQF